MDEMEWAVWALGYLKEARGAMHGDFNELMQDIPNYRGAGGQEWFSSTKNIIQTLYHYSYEFPAETRIPSATDPSPAAFSVRLGSYRAFVDTTIVDLQRTASSYADKEGTAGAPFLVEQAEKFAAHILGAIDHVLSKQPHSMKADEACKAESAKDHIVLIVHGIRDRGEWQRMMQDVLEDNTSITVKPISYDYFDLVRFLLPSPFRNGPIKVVQRNLATTLALSEGKRVSVIAHSYGTIAITKVLEQNRMMAIHHLLLCGSIVSRSYDWGATRKQVKGLIINDYGVRDPWPVVATSVTWGYGTSGAYGFKDATIDRDRDHNFGHSGFMNSSFVEKYWKSALSEDKITPVDRSQSGYTNTPWYFRLLSLPWKYVLTFLILWTLVNYVWPEKVADFTFQVRKNVSERLGWSIDSRRVPASKLLSLKCDLPLSHPSPSEVAEAIDAAEFLKTDRWLRLALAEVGQSETAGPRTNPRIAIYNSSSENLPQSDEIPWNGQFVQWAMREAGESGMTAGSIEFARTWLQYGRDTSLEGIDAVTGAIVIAKRPDEPSYGGVVGFYLAHDSEAHESSIRMLAGNICGAVNVITVPESLVLGYRVPTEWRGPPQ
jgi:uncharacterized protein (TIGR02594 family)